MVARLRQRQQDASNLVQVHKDHLERGDQQRQKRLEKSQHIMGLVLAIFSPLAFISGIYGMNITKPDGT